ncbi:MAG: HAD hydrolase-like protein [Xenococcaceae cyanobacterium MO_188.B32]|nr:HAD hydrolase-like protein [Xenococcaceae cyanobacterium MO_188.B32]
MLSAILFDLDGTLANTDTLHFSIWQEMLAVNYYFLSGCSSAAVLPS